MKKMYKAMLLVLCAILLVAGSVMGTLAYLKDTTGPVTNTFTTGKVEITLHEYEINNDTGKKTNVETNGLTGIKLVPGRVIEKNPVITVKAGSETCYLFVKVENELDGVATINWDTTKWTQIGSTNYYYYNVSVTAASDTKVTVFESITCASNIEEYSTVGNLAITAYAIQAEGFNDNILAAWTASGYGN